MVDTIVFTFDEYWFYSPLDRKFHTTKSITHPPQRSPHCSPIKKRRLRVSEPPFGISGGKHRIGCPGFQAGNASLCSPASVRSPAAENIRRLSGFRAESVSSDSPAPVRLPGGKHPSAPGFRAGSASLCSPASVWLPGGGKCLGGLPGSCRVPQREAPRRDSPHLRAPPRYMRSGTLMPSSAMPLRITSATSRARARRIERIEAFSSLRIEWSW